MSVITRFKDKTVSGTASDGASTVRGWIDEHALTVNDVRKQTASVIKDARKQATSAAKDARRQSRRQVTRARIAAARARSRGDGPSKKSVAAAGAAGLAGAFFLDPESGKRRRHIARDRALALIRQGAETTRPAANDQALAERVKSEIFQPADAPKGSVNVNVERGVVYLRGEVRNRDQIKKLVEQAGAVDGVAGVENLLHAS
jgi:osmotically-inducible protein OsmY